LHTSNPSCQVTDVGGTNRELQSPLQVGPCPHSHIPPTHPHIHTHVHAEQFKKAMTEFGTDWAIWNKGEKKKCHSAKDLDFMWDFASMFVGKTTMCNPEEPEKHGQFLTAQTKVNGDFKYNEVRIPVVNFQSD
jgi:hypothetical protein